MDKYYNYPTDRCCEQVKTFMVHDVDISGLVAYYMRIEYKHKESIPCLRVMRESASMSFYDISNDSYSMTELRSSPFFIRPLINMDIKAIENSTLEIVKFVDSNTDQLISDMALQADVTNLLVVYPRDIYGNEIIGVENIQFTAVLNDSLNILEVNSSYNKVLKRYEIFIVPNISYSEA